MAKEPLRFFHRYKQSVETERVFGERWLRFAYEIGLGQLGVGLLAKRRIFSSIYGWQMNKRVSAHKVLPFIVEYDLDVDEFAKSPFDFRNFNEFFYRALKPACRPIHADALTAVFPADGRHLVFPNVDTAEGFYVKGAKFTLGELLGDPALAAKFAGGAMLISRLCPVDYHRFHFPVNGHPATPTLINGWLYSVNPIALRKNIRYLVQNKRMLTLIKSPEFGAVAMLEVGATNVGSIKQTFVEDRIQPKGEEKGLFKFGGSCVITLFQPGRIKFDHDLITQSANYVETYARMGDRLGVAIR
ncbi:MAG: archaetidylserine decarboxylase [Cephaloticoccus sp.]|nr:archaetidylserine decarboxylase [Cephaloticoccus sp.]MCF7761319.1 archaetidylserine decarboxylase [Cephaloticoccus sp.]